MTKTVLGPGGYPRPPYGSFAGKPASGGRSGHFTVLGPGGYSRPPYGSFAGKPGGGGGSKVYTQQFSVLSPRGGPRPPYGSFAGKISPPPPNPIPVLVGSVTYLLMFNSKGAAVSDVVLAQFYNPYVPVPPNCCQDILVYDAVTGQIDPRYGIFITLPAPVVGSLFFHPNLELVANSPNSLAQTSILIENNLPRAVSNYRFVVSGLGMFPLKF